MQKIAAYFAVLGCLAFGLSACVSDECETVQTYQVWEPHFVKAEEFRGPIQAQPPRDLCANGQLYYYQNFLLIAAPNEGIHIIDNGDPTAPQPVAFLPIPGVQNIAIRNDRLYTNSYVDLLVFDFRTPSAPQLLNRTEDIFMRYGYMDAEQGYLVDYIARDEEVTVPCGTPIWNNCFDCIFFDRAEGVAFSQDATSAALNDASNGGSGIGGSLARFTMAQGYLYVIDESSLRIFDLSNGSAPQLANTIQLWGGIETIFPYGDKLFLGANTGMFIYDAVDPVNPVQIGLFQHANACDPVFVDGDIAYVTLRDGTDCQEFTNQLDVVDVSDLTNPVLLRTYPMHHPIGISVADKYLYLCDDDAGLKVFDVSSTDNIDQRLVSHLRTMTTRDVITIPGKQQAIIVGDGGLLQLDITDPNNLRQLSLIPACN